MDNLEYIRLPRRLAPKPTGALNSGWPALAILVVLTLVASLDRQIIILMGESLRASLGLSDTQLGVLQGVGISLIAGLAALFVGWATDRYDLRIVLIVILVVWGMATVIGANSGSYTALFLSSTGMGLFETAMAPIVYAFIPRAFPEETRTLANSVYATLNLLLMGSGIAVAGAVVKAASAMSELDVFPWGGLDTWRTALLLTALGGAFCAMLVVFLRTTAPLSVMASNTPTPAPSIWPYLSRHRMAMVCVFSAFGLGGMGLSAVTTWMPVIAERGFGATADEIASSMAVSYVVGIVVGAVVGTFGMRVLQRRAHGAAPVRIVAGGCFVAGLASVLLSFVTSPVHIYLLLGVMVSALIAGVVLAPTMMQDMANPCFLSRIVALGTVVSMALTSLGAPCVGILSDVLGADSGSVRIAASVVGAVALATAALLLTIGERSYLATVATAREAQ